jgi:hypothetical protein
MKTVSLTMHDWSMNSKRMRMALFSCRDLVSS